MKATHPVHAPNGGLSVKTPACALLRGLLAAAAVAARARRSGAGRFAASLAVAFAASSAAQAASKAAGFCGSSPAILSCIARSPIARCHTSDFGQTPARERGERRKRDGAKAAHLSEEDAHVRPTGRRAVLVVAAPSVGVASSTLWQIATSRSKRVVWSARPTTAAAAAAAGSRSAADSDAATSLPSASGHLPILPMCSSCAQLSQNAQRCSPLGFGVSPAGSSCCLYFLAAFLYFPGFRGGLYFPLLPCSLLYFPGT